MSDEKWLESYTKLLEDVSHHRHPKSKQEKSVAAVADKDEEEPKVRAKRNAKNLPDSWDDKPKHTERNWKKQRKTQYKLKEGPFSFLNSLLAESISFQAARYNEEKGYFDSGPSGYREEECWVCKGSGEDSRGGECGYCDGKGTAEQPHYDQEPLNVSNMNAGYILRDFLGMEFKESGDIPPDRIPEFKRRLIKIKNDSKARAAGVEDVSSVGGGRVRSKDESGMDRIGRSAQLIDMGRTSDQVTRYIDDLLEIFDHAQKNGMHVVWY